MFTHTGLTLSSFFLHAPKPRTTSDGWWAIWPRFLQLLTNQTTTKAKKDVIANPRSPIKIQRPVSTVEIRLYITYLHLHWHVLYKRQKKGDLWGSNFKPHWVELYFYTRTGVGKSGESINFTKFESRWDHIWTLNFLGLFLHANRLRWLSLQATCLFVCMFTCVGEH